MNKTRIAVGQVSLESNHFVSHTCELDHFRNTGYLWEGNEVFKLREAGTEVSGALCTLETDGNVEIVPLLAARGTASGPLSSSCYAHLKEHLLARLRDAGHVDGVFLSHHGSMVAADECDPEGEIASSVREIVGPRVPIVMTLDLHGNVTCRMVESLTGIVGYSHYPHDDVLTTGVRATELLLEATRGKVQPRVGYVKLPMLLTAFHGTTDGDGPFAQLMRQAKLLEREPGVLSVSMFFVGSYIDVREIGCGVLVITDPDGARAVTEAENLAKRFWSTRWKFSVETISINAAVRKGRDIDGGPVLLLDTADTTGGGAAGDGIGLVKGLLEAGVTEPCLAMVVDPEAAQKCIQAGVGAELTIRLGHAIDPKWGRPITVTGEVVRTLDGHFQYTGGILGGTWVSMGPSAIFKTGPIQVLIMTYPTYEWADEQYRAAGLKPEEAKFVGVKNMMNFRHAYRGIMKAFFVLNIPGPTPADMRQLAFRRIPRPMFPFDANMDEPIVQVSTGGTK